NCYRLRIYKSNDTFPPIGIVLGTENINSLSHFDVYPNPVNESVTISVPASKEEDGVIAIHDLLGEIVYSEKVKLKQGNTPLQIPVKEFSAGPYTIVINSEGKTMIGKFVKQ